MRVAEFLSHFDPSAAVRVLLRGYRRRKVVEGRLPRMVRALFLMLLKEYRHVTQLHSHPNAGPEDALLLGYGVDRDGRVIMDSYETLGQLINERFTPLWEEVMEAFLPERGHEEEVGAHFRNMRMAEYEECPDGYLEACHGRNVVEGFNDYTKERLDLESDLPRGRERVRVHVMSRLTAMVVAALTSAQNSVFEDLGSVAYIL
jgi:hypothetical protein